MQKIIIILKYNQKSLLQTQLYLKFKEFGQKQQIVYLIDLCKVFKIYVKENLTQIIIKESENYKKKLN